VGYTLITDYPGNTLPLPERIRFEKHLAECKDCTTYLRQMQQTIQLVGHLTEDAIAPANRNELLKLFRDWKNAYGKFPTACTVSLPKSVPLTTARSSVSGRIHHS
jgi:hypothetical protein